MDYTKSVFYRNYDSKYQWVAERRMEGQMDGFNRRKEGQMIHGKEEGMNRRRQTEGRSEDGRRDGRIEVQLALSPSQEYIYHIVCHALFYQDNGRTERRKHEWMEKRIDG